MAARSSFGKSCFEMFVSLQLQAKIIGMSISHFSVHEGMLVFFGKTIKSVMVFHISE